MENQEIVKKDNDDLTVQEVKEIISNWRRVYASDVSALSVNMKGMRRYRWFLLKALRYAACTQQQDAVRELLLGIEKEMKEKRKVLSRYELLLNPNVNCLYGNGATDLCESVNAIRKEPLYGCENGEMQILEDMHKKLRAHLDMLMETANEYELFDEPSLDELDDPSNYKTLDVNDMALYSDGALFFVPPETDEVESEQEDPENTKQTS